MNYKIGDILVGKDFLTGAAREYQVTKTTQKSVFFKCVRIGDMSVSGEVQKARPDERGELWTKGGVRLNNAA